MHGTWKAAGGGASGAAGMGLGSVAALALLSWLATVLWILAIIGFAVLAVIIGGVFLLRRRTRADDEAFAERAAALRADAARQATAPQPPVIVNHYHGGTHVHLEPGADAPAVIRQALPRDIARPGEG